MRIALPSPSLRVLIGSVLLAAVYFLMVHPALAQTSTYGYTSFSCNGAIASGTMYDSSLSCPTTMKLGNIFSFLVCNMERLASNLLGQMYCGIMTDLIPAVMAMCTLAVLFFGTGFTIGVIPATARDFQMFLLKIVFVVVFATQSDYLIGTGYNILITGLREGTAIGISTMMNNAGAANASQFTGSNVYSYLDSFLGKAMHFATDYVGLKWDTNNNPCKNAVFAVLAIMAIAFPPVFFVAIMIIFRICITFLRAIFGYLYSIIGIVFLLTLAPFFLSFFLFRQTRPFFDKWIGYLVSFCMQMVILFAFMGFMLTLDVRHISGSLTDIIVPQKETLEATTMLAPWKYCTLCDFKVVNKDSGAEIKETDYDNFLEKGKLVCKENPGKPIGVLDASGPGKKPTAAQTAQKNSITSALLKFASTGLLSLFVLAYLVEYMLGYAPALAATLAGGMGAMYAPQLGGGTAIGQKISMDVPGGSFIDTFQDGFTKGYSENMGYTGLGAAGMGVVEGMKRMVTGGSDIYGQDPGLVQTWTTFALNPQSDTFGRH